MNYLLSFIWCGIVCALSQFFLEKTKLTPGHINTTLVVIGCFLSGIGLYDKIIDIFHSGATSPIMNFGHLLVIGASEGYDNYGFIGLFKGVFTYAGYGVSVACFSAFIVSLITRSKN